MTEAERKLLRAYRDANGATSREAFIAAFPGDLSAERIEDDLRQALASRDERVVSDTVLLGCIVRFDAGHAETLARLLREDWHHKHEVLAFSLQGLARERCNDGRTPDWAPEILDALYQAAVSNHPYLKFDDNFALARKCAFALGEIRTPAAVERLRLLATSDNPVIRDHAREQFEHLGIEDSELLFSALMTEVERSALQAYVDANGAMSREDFISAFPGDLSAERIEDDLREARVLRGQDEVSDVVLLGSIVGFEARHADALARLLAEDWHLAHEDLASSLQDLARGSREGSRDDGPAPEWTPDILDALYQAAVANHPYLDFDDNFALARKCAWALGQIRTPAAVEKLRLLATSDNPVIRDHAREQFERLGIRG
jgi:hypothetical protein